MIIRLVAGPAFGSDGSLTRSLPLIVDLLHQAVRQTVAGRVEGGGDGRGAVSLTGCVQYLVNDVGHRSANRSLCNKDSVNNRCSLPISVDNLQ